LVNLKSHEEIIEVLGEIETCYEGFIPERKIADFANHEPACLP
jgi:hypothetical protein